MEYGIGIVLALAVWCFARVTGFDRDRAFYATVAMVVASYYVLFAAMGGSTRAVLVESSIMTAFVIVAVAGFKRNLWLVVAALAGHGVLDSFRGHVAANPAVPEWWPAFCMAYDVAAAGGLAWLLLRSKLAVRPDHYNRAIPGTVGEDELVPLGLRSEELRQIEAFLGSLDGEPGERR